MKEKTNIEKSFRFALIGIHLILLSVIALIVNANWNSYGLSLFVGLTYLTASVIGINGLVYCINGLKEKRSLKMLFSFIVNISLVILLLVLIVAGIYTNTVMA